MITTVSTSSALNAALKAAHGGDTIQLASGTYSGIVASNLDFTTDVTITSKDINAPAVITGLSMSGSSGINFSNLEFSAQTAGNPFIVASSQDIHFDHLDVHGSLDGNAQDDYGAFLVRSSSDVSISNSEFQQLHTAIAHLDDSHINFSGNSFHDIGMDAIRGGGSSYVTISGNTFRDFYPKVGEHPDMIQFWTVNTTASAHDITVSDNLFIRGAGAVAQGVFMGNEASLPYQHVTISGNYILGGMYNGITVSKASDVSITGNVVAGFSDMKSWIRLDGVNGATVTGNSTDQLSLTSTDTNIVHTGNTIIPLLTDAGAALYAKWLLLHPDTSIVSAGDALPVDSVSGGLLLTGGSGAESLTGGAGADTLSGGAGNDTVDGGAGRSYLRGDDGDDSITGGGQFDDINGNMGNDTVSGGLGDDYSVGGKDQDLLFGNGGVDIVWGNLGNDTCDGGDGNDQVRGGQGDDSVSGGAGDDFVSGDRGADTITGGSGADRFHGSQDAGIDRVLDFNLAEGDRVFLDHGTTYTLAQVGADTVIDMGGGHQMILVGVQLSTLTPGWIFAS
jgi:Ca2+-binding RTX toxin-like protein